METVIVIMIKVFLLVLSIALLAFFVAVSLCVMANDENDDEQQMKWIQEHEARRQEKREGK